MKLLSSCRCVALSLLFSPAALWAEDSAAEAKPEAPADASAATEQAAPAEFAPAQPGPQHQWLQRFVGTWESKTKCTPGPGQPEMEGTGTEVVKGLGDLWIVAEGRGDMAGMTMNYLMTLGYDSKKEKFVGTWVDSVTGVLWLYEGTLDEAKNSLILESSGLCPMTGEQKTMRDTTTFTDDNHRTFTSEVRNPDGSWTTVVTGESTRES